MTLNRMNMVGIVDHRMGNAIRDMDLHVSAAFRSVTLLTLSGPSS